MKKIVVSFFIIFFIVLEQVFAASEVQAAIPWKDLLLKSLNFFALVGIIWFFFGKKIVLFLKTTAQNEYDDFFSLEKEKQKLEQTLIKTQAEVETEKIKTNKNETLYFQQINLEKNKIKKEAEEYQQKLEKNNKIILQQEQQAAKQLLYKKIFEKALEKLENTIKNKEVIISEEKYLSQFFQKLKNR